MAAVTKNGITVDGNGTNSAVASATVNEGLDRSASFRFTNIEGAYADLTINQEGRREVWNSDFLCSDGETFNVIKQGYV
jgi:hypothetical protein